MLCFPVIYVSNHRHKTEISRLRQDFEKQSDTQQATNNKLQKKDLRVSPWYIRLASNVGDIISSKGGILLGGAGVFEVRHQFYAHKLANSQTQVVKKEKIIQNQKEELSIQTKHINELVNKVDNLEAQVLVKEIERDKKEFYRLLDLDHLENFQSEVNIPNLENYKVSFVDVDIDVDKDKDKTTEEPSFIDKVKNFDRRLGKTISNQLDRLPFSLSIDARFELTSNSETEEIPTKKYTYGHQVKTGTFGFINTEIYDLDLKNCNSLLY